MSDRTAGFEIGYKTEGKSSPMAWIIGAIIALILLCCCSISSSLSSGLGYKWMNPQDENQ